MNYGVPYMGSKNTIARAIVDCLPPAEYFVDLFAGGCAVTHAAMLSNGKYKKFIANDIDWRGVTLFRDAIAGKYHDEKRVITREEFNSLKDKDAYVALCWSFGNNGNGYLWGGKNETLKVKAMRLVMATTWHERLKLYKDFAKCIMNGGVEVKEEAEPLCEVGGVNRLEELEPLERLEPLEVGGVNRLYELQAFEALDRMQALERLERMQALERLERMQALERLEIFNISYEMVEIPDNACVYCDIPYKDTAKYSTDFDHDKFYDWVRSQSRPIFISEYAMPEDFKIVWAQKKNTLLSSKGTTGKKTEKLFVHESQFDKVHKTDLFGFEDL